MTVFNQYAEYYDALYAEKDYAAECNFIETVIKKYTTQPVNTILDLGCGTGEHAFQLAQHGYTVCGVDQSSDMLTIAQEKKSKLVDGGNITFQQGDIRSLQLFENFDVGVSMFAVMSYMTGNNDLQRALKMTRRHLRPGGLFIFDAWYGPGVLTDPPADRYKFVQKGKTRVVRFAHPVVDSVHHKVDVNYKLISLIGDRLVNEIDETHTMRFFFPQEINFHLESAGFEVLRLCPFIN